MSDRESLTRWRLVLGADGEEGLGCGLGGADAARDRALGFLYDREYGGKRNVRGTGDRKGPRSAGLEDSVLTVPDWINQASGQISCISRATSSINFRL